MVIFQRSAGQVLVTVELDPLLPQDIAAVGELGGVLDLVLRTLAAGHDGDRPERGDAGPAAISDEDEP